MSTLDRLLPASAFFSAASSVVSLVWLKSSEPLSGAVLPAAGALADALADEEVVAAELLLLDELEHAVRASSAPALAAMPAANFLFMHNLLFAYAKASQKRLNFSTGECS